MMVKDEQDLLPQCLESIKGIADEIIIVDTGSKDNTVEIAKASGAKIFYHPWEKNFSKHRNQSIAYATGDWILIIDADERFYPLLPISTIKQQLQDLPHIVCGVRIPVQDIKKNGVIVQTFMSSRLFRTKRDFHYEGIVHNNPVILGDIINKEFCYIRHHGYDLPKEKMEQKKRRTLSLLKQRLKDNPKDISAHYYLANSYGFIPDFKNAIKHGMKCLRMFENDLANQIPLYDILYRVIGKSFVGLRDYKNALKWFDLGLLKLPKDPDLSYEAAMVCFETKDPERALRYSQDYMDQVERYRENPALANGRTLYALDKVFENSLREKMNSISSQ